MPVGIENLVKPPEAYDLQHPHPSAERLYGVMLGKVEKVVSGQSPSETLCKMWGGHDSSHMDDEEGIGMGMIRHSVANDVIQRVMAYYGFNDHTHDDPERGSYKNGMQSELLRYTKPDGGIVIERSRIYRPNEVLNRDDDYVIEYQAKASDSP